MKRLLRFHAVLTLVFALVFIPQAVIVVSNQELRATSTASGGDTLQADVFLTGDAFFAATDLGSTIDSTLLEFVSWSVPTAHLNLLPSTVTILATKEATVPLPIFVLLLGALLLAGIAFRRLKIA